MEKYFTDNEGNIITRREWFHLISKGSRIDIVAPLVELTSLDVTRNSLAELTKFHNKMLDVIELALHGAISLRVDNSFCTKVIVYSNGTVIVALQDKNIVTLCKPDVLMRLIRKEVVNNIRSLKKMLALAESTYVDIIEE